MLSGDILRLSAKKHPAKTALIYRDQRLSYGELERRSNQFAHAVLGLGLGKGDCVAVMCPNIPEYAIVHFGNARTGCLLVNLSIMFGPDELTYILSKTRAKVLIVEEESQAAISAVLDKLPDLEKIVVIGEPDGLDAIRLDAFLKDRSTEPPNVALADTDPFAMTFTGGTTGLPKGALVSHRARHISAYTVAIEHELTGNDVVAAVTPLYHAVGLLIWFQAAILVGAEIVMLGRWDPGAFVEATGTHGISAVMTVPVQLHAILSDEHFDAGKLATLTKIASGGANVPADLIHLCRAKLPRAAVIDHYGQSETGPLTFLKHFDPPEKADSIGRPAIGVDLEVVDPDGKPVPTGEVGEIVIRGDFLFEGYFENAEETAAYFRKGDGWGWTGDLAVIDEDGFITMAGRSKEMIISGGVNIYPREVERVLEEHDVVADCTVFGIPDDEWGEALVAYVVPANVGGVTPEDLLDHCTGRLARFKRPKVLKFVDTIPKTPAGKVQKPLLRDAYLKESGST